METESVGKKPTKILIVDDVSVNIEILQNIIADAGYQSLCASGVKEALEVMSSDMPQLILSDFYMPEINGLEFCKMLKSNPRTRDIPFIFITVENSSKEKKEAFLAGAVDFIPKPFDWTETIMRINNQLNSYKIKLEMEDYNRMMHKMVKEQKEQMEKEQENVLIALAKVLEKVSVNRGKHMQRVGYNSRMLAQSLQLVPHYEHVVTDQFVDTIETASRLHNIGSILMTCREALGDDMTAQDELNALHISMDGGADILEEISGHKTNSRFMDMAIKIARYHHANWDGTGRPQDGLKGENIPLEARITAVTNDFDAMLNSLSGKPTYSIEESLRMINERSGSFYDPSIINVFNKVWRQFHTV